MYGTYRLPEYIRTLTIFGELALGWGPRRVARRPTIVRPCVALRRRRGRHPFATRSSGPNWIPQTVSADAALGFLRMADRGAVVAMTMCIAGKFALARREGAAT